MLRVLVLTLAATSIFAQTPPKKTPVAPQPVPVLTAESPMPGRNLDEDSVLVLNQKLTLKELAVDANFKTSYAKIYSDLDTSEQAAVKNGSSDAQLDKLRLDADHAALALLSATQATRLKELALQAFGLEAFGISEVQEKLALSTEQRGLIGNVLKTWNGALDAYGEKVAAVAAANPQSDSDNSKVARDAADKASKAFRALKPERAKLATEKEALTKQIMGLLDVRQKAEYKAMLGNPVKVVEPAY